MLILRKKLVTSVYHRIDNKSSCLSEDVLSKGQCLVVVKKSFENVYSDVKKKKCLCFVFEYDRCTQMFLKSNVYFRNNVSSKPYSNTIEGAVVKYTW